MISIQNLLGIICTEAVTGESGSQCLDHQRGTGYVPRTDPYKGKRDTNSSDLPPIKYDLELIRGPGGSLTWVE